jgi:hypothetical protein
MSENLRFGPSEEVQGTPDEVRTMYPFGYFVMSDGSVWGRDPLQEANAGIDVDPSEIDEALQMIEDDRQREENPFLYE